MDNNKNYQNLYKKYKKNIWNSKSGMMKMNLYNQSLNLLFI